MDPQIPSAANISVPYLADASGADGEQRDQRDLEIVGEPRGSYRRRDQGSDNHHSGRNNRNRAGRSIRSTNTGYISGVQNVFVISGGAGSTGQAFSASPSPLAFGNQIKGTTSSAKTLTSQKRHLQPDDHHRNAGWGQHSGLHVGSDTCANATVRPEKPAR